MKFTINLADFNRALNKVIQAIPKRTALPVLEHFLFVLSENTLDVIATNQDIILKASVSVEGEEDGKVLVPAKKISDIAKVMDNVGTVEFVVDLTNYDITLKTDAGIYDMKGLDADEYLKLPELFDSEKPDLDNPPADDNKHIAVLKASDIQRLFANTTFAVAQDDYRPALSGLLMQFRGQYAYVVGTDSFRLSRGFITASEHTFPTDFDVIIPAASAEILKKVDQEVILSSISNFDKITHLRFDYDNVVFITKIITEKFPPYETVIPDNNEVRLTLSKTDFINAIKRVSIFANSNHKYAKLNLKSDHIILSSENESKGDKGMETLPCDYTGDDMTIGFNHEFLEEAIMHLEKIEGDDNVYLFLATDPNRPVLMSAEPELGQTIMLLMPTRII